MIIKDQETILYRLKNIRDPDPTGFTGSEMFVQQMAEKPSLNLFVKKAKGSRRYLPVCDGDAPSFMDRQKWSGITFESRFEPAEIQVGSIVVVDDLGKLYSTYDELARQFRLTRWARDLDHDLEPGEAGDTRFKVIAIGPHESAPSEHFGNVAGIEGTKSGKQYLVGLEGLSAQQSLNSEETEPGHLVVTSPDQVIYRVRDLDNCPSLEGCVIVDDVKAQPGLNFLVRTNDICGEGFVFLHAPDLDLWFGNPTQELEKSPFQIGTEVRVKDLMESFPSADGLAKRMKLTKFETGVSLSATHTTDDNFVIVGATASSNPLHYGVVFGLESLKTGQQFLVLGSTLAAVEEEKPQLPFKVGDTVRFTDDRAGCYAYAASRADEMGLTYYKASRMPSLQLMRSASFEVIDLVKSSEAGDWMVGIRCFRDGQEPQDFIVKPVALVLAASEEEKPDEDQPPFEVGDTVRITDVSQVLTEASFRAEDLGLKHFVRGRCPHPMSIFADFEVVGVGHRCKQPDEPWRVGIRTIEGFGGPKDFVVKPEGLELVEGVPEWPEVGPSTAGRSFQTPPKFGDFAKMGKLKFPTFTPPSGFKLVEVDDSDLETRMASAFAGSIAEVVATAPDELVVKLELDGKAIHLASINHSKENTMTDSSKIFETRSYVYGLDVTTMNEQDLIGAIKRAEDQIKALKEVKTKSEHIKSKIAGMKSQLDKIVAELDSRE